MKKATESAALSSNKTSPAGMEDWQVEDDLRTILAAAKIENDPKRMNAVRALAKKKSAEIQHIVQEESDEGKKK